MFVKYFFKNSLKIDSYIENWQPSMGGYVYKGTSKIFNREFELMVVLPMNDDIHDLYTTECSKKFSSLYSFHIFEKNKSFYYVNRFTKSYFEKKYLPDLVDGYMTDKCFHNLKKFAFEFFEKNYKKAFK